MFKKTIIYSLFFFLFVIPIVVKAAPGNAPFVLKDEIGEYVGTVDLQPLWDKIYEIELAISNISGNPTNKTIKAFDSLGTEVGVFVNSDQLYTKVFLTNDNYLISLNTYNLQIQKIPSLYSSEPNCTGTYYVYNPISLNTIYSTSFDKYFIVDSSVSPTPIGGLYDCQSNNQNPYENEAIKLKEVQKPSIDSFQGPLHLEYN